MAAPERRWSPALTLVVVTVAGLAVAGRPRRSALPTEVRVVARLVEPSPTGRGCTCALGDWPVRWVVEQVEVGEIGDTTLTTWSFCGTLMSDGDYPAGARFRLHLIPHLPRWPREPWPSAPQFELHGTEALDRPAQRRRRGPASTGGGASIGTPASTGGAGAGTWTVTVRRVAIGRHTRGPHSQKRRSRVTG